MIDFGYDIWINVINEIKSISKTHGQYFMQLFPFYCCNDLTEISSEDYYDKYIKTGCFLLNDVNYIMANNYNIKKDGSFRKRFAISPIFYIYYICIGHYVYSKSLKNENEKIKVFYSGNFKSDELHYLNSYKSYMKEITNNSYQYEKYIKVDIQSFYSTIDFRVLKQKLKDYTSLTDTEICIIENFLLLIGNGHFPETEMGTTSAFIATELYLADFDNCLKGYLDNLSDISDFYCVRYIDDLFIFFNKSDTNKTDIYIENKIVNYINTELFKDSLSLNKQKTKMNDTQNIYEDIKMVSFLNEESLQDVTLDTLTKDVIIGFFDELDTKIKENGINFLQFVDLINKYFENKKSKYFASQIYQSFCFSASKNLIDEEIKLKIESVIESDYKVLSHDPRTLVSLIMNVEDGALIKKILNKSFTDFRNDDWDIYNTYIIFQYLLRRRFLHKDLLRIIKYVDADLLKYINQFCITKWIKYHNTRFIKVFVDKCFISESKITFLYFMYKKEYLLGNIMPSFAYYKNYFDMITGHFAEAVGKNSKFSTKYYKEGATKQFYKGELPNENVFIEQVVKDANDLRNSNPVCHGSGELLNNLTQKQTIDKSITDLELLIQKEMITNFNL